MKTQKSTSLDQRIQQIEQAIHRPAQLRARGWETVDLLTLMVHSYTPGASVAVIEDGEIAYAKGYGVVEARKPAPVTVETRFQAASISKPVAALVALSLVEEGRLALDEDIRRFQTSWSLPENDGWRPRVTLRMLLSHSAGVTVSDFLGYPRRAPFPSLRQVLDGERPANSPAIRVDTLPGLQFRYSGGGYTVLQQLIEDAAGKPFWQAAEERVLRPLDMAHSTYECPLPMALHPAAATGHRDNGDPLEGQWHVHPESAAAGLWTTPLDLARLIVELEATLRGQGGKVISQGLAQEMLSPQKRVRGIGLQGWEGLGFFLTGEEGDRYYGHGGSNVGFRCSLIARKGKGQGAIIMSNSDRGGEVNEAWMDTIAVAYGWSGYAWHPPAPVARRPEALAQFAGEYRLKDGRPLRVRQEQGRLALEIEGQPALEMVPRAKSRFFLTQINAEVRFIGKRGRAEVLVLRQDGEDFKAQRVG